MGVYDRGYMRRTGPPPIALGMSWTLRHILLLAAVFVVANGAQGWWGWRGWGSLLLSRESLEDGRWWTVVTSALLHAGVWHLVFNLLGLWYFGKLVEETVGGARFVAFFWIAAVVSHVPFLVVEFATGGRTATVGASGIVTAALVFAAFRYPGMPFGFWGLPLLLWQLALLYVAIDVFGAVSRTGSTDYWTHLGGAAYGFVVHRLGVLPRIRLLGRAPPPREPGPYAEGNARAEIDRLLDKIASDGIGSLTEDEREFLKRNAERYR
jgi:membrane associated rhomboid family serine protease